MFNIVCLKWGDAYSAEYVNKLYSMISRHFHLPFQMYCFTDDPTEVTEKVICKPIQDTRWVKWWNKIPLISSNAGLEGASIFFDLDVIIYNDITSLVYEFTDYLTIAECHWVDPVRNFKGYERNLSCDLNSSIMLWKRTPQVDQLYNFFDVNCNRLMQEYKGIDKVLYYHEYKEFEIRTIGKQWIQSYHHSGFDESKGSVLIFNQGEKQHEINDQRVKRLWI
jgi:hypothetical protein